LGRTYLGKRGERGEKASLLAYLFRKGVAPSRKTKKKTTTGKGNEQKKKKRPLRTSDESQGGIKDIVRGEKNTDPII